jgi:hypothetical protein
MFQPRILGSAVLIRAGDTFAAAEKTDPLGLDLRGWNEPRA